MAHYKTIYSEVMGDGSDTLDEEENNPNNSGGSIELEDRNEIIDKPLKTDIDTLRKTDSGRNFI